MPRRRRRVPVEFQDKSHIRLYPELLRSPAWISLRPHARALLIAIWERNDGSNNGEIGYGVRAAREALHCRPDKVKQAFVDLQEKGFIVVTRGAQFDGKDDRRPRTWRLTTETCGDHHATMDFLRWRPRTSE